MSFGERLLANASTWADQARHFASTLPAPYFIFLVVFAVLLTAYTVVESVLLRRQLVPRVEQLLSEKLNDVRPYVSITYIGFFVMGGLVGVVLFLLTLRYPSIKDDSLVSVLAWGYVVLIWAYTSSVDVLQFQLISETVPSAPFLRRWAQNRVLRHIGFLLLVVIVLSTRSATFSNSVVLEGSRASDAALLDRMVK